MNILFLYLFVVLVSSKIRFPEPKANPNPEVFYQRYRRDYYASDPFFQWWYVWVRDTEKNINFAFSYGMSTCDTKKANKTCKYDGAFIMFSMVSGNKTFVKYERFDLADFRVLDEKSPHISIFNGKFGITPLDNDNYRFWGEFDEEDLDHVWYFNECEKDLKVKWNFTVNRAYGWYGQEIFEIFDEWIKGMIMWNTYGHTSQITGSSSNILEVGSEKYDLTSPDQYRVYCDMNWGDHFPSGPVGNKDFSWGWFVINDPKIGNIKDDFSFIAGSGQSDSGTKLGVMDAQFADIRINSTYELSIRKVEVRKGDKFLDEVFYSSTDGDLLEFSIVRSNWENYEDRLGKAEYPLDQSIVLRTRDFDISVNITSTSDRYNRLLFPYQDALFSDFEGLGVDCHVQVFDKTSGKMIIDLEQKGQTGVEYGYKFDTKPVL